MSFSVTLYNTSSDNEKINKSLGSGVDFDIIMKEQTDAFRPSFRIASSSNLSGYNYCYIPRYGRYYFIESVEATPNGYWVFTCRCDVLMSFKTAILGLQGTITRSESVFNAYLNDPEYKALAYRKCVTKAFPNEINNDHIILITIG